MRVNVKTDFHSPSHTGLKTTVAFLTFTVNPGLSLPSLPGPRRAALKASPFSHWGYTLLSLVGISPGRNWSLASYFFPSNPTLLVLQSTLPKHHVRPQWKHLPRPPVTYSFICDSVLAQCCSSPRLYLHISPPNALASSHLSPPEPFGMPVP